MYIRSIISLEIIIQIYLVVLYTKLALFCGLTEGQDFEFKQAGYDKIDIPSPKVWIRDVSFEVCRDECKVRPSCTAVNYHTFVFLCELDLEPSPEVVPTTDRGLLYWIKTTLEDQIQCGTESCGRGFVCDKQKNKCEVKECGTLSIPNSTVILGNVNAVGAKLQMRCKDEFLALGPAFITLTCGTNGNWSTDRLVCIKDPECKGQFEVCTQIGEECSNEKEEKCCTDSDMDCGTANIGECFCEFGRNSSGKCYPECKGQFEVCTQIGDYDGCNSNDELGECFCKHVNETDKNKCCEECSDDDKEKCCTDSDMDCGMANIGECFCKFGEDPSGTCFSGHVIICEDNSSSVECPLGKNISVYDAYYGRTHDNTVCFHPATTDQNCRADNSTEMIKTDCNDKQECKLEAKFVHFGDPCPGTYKYIEVKFFCVGA
ncbi:uncharacterized protein LOC128205442 isoform X2 [Mya arenaria]|uniref:uncharacterized protein LOC128205442 isoform X2 n=1 Tax=Mya arenaria TaxID=6604 RepID=UPI0022E377D5|nr:uncharacterized protein LOC128205442 isoform X2 [Mya arenaria]